MNAVDVIKLFATRETVPVDVDEVVTAFRENGVKDEVYFWGVDIDPTALRGTINYWEYPASEDGPTRYCADIYYA